MSQKNRRVFEKAYIATKEIPCDVIQKGKKVN